MLLGASRAAIERYLLRAGAQQQTRSSNVRPLAGTDRQTDGRPTDT